MPSKFELSDTTPAAPGGRTNVLWQSDSAGNVSGNVPGGVSVASPYIVIGSQKYIGSNMYPVTVPSAITWTPLNSEPITVAAGTNGNVSFTTPNNANRYWAYSGVMTSFTTMDWMGGLIILSDNSSAVDFLGLEVFDSANNNVRGWAFQNTFGLTRVVAGSATWNGVTSTDPASWNWNHLSQQTVQTVPVVLRVVNDGAPKTISYWISLDGGVTFFKMYTDGPFGNVPSFTGLLVNVGCCYLQLYSVKVS